jgi:Na+-transporting methylmalonyl-CoA/oxaloacetate decarboxylase gamma subunit
MNLLSAISVYGQVFDSLTWKVVLVGIGIVFIVLLIMYFFFRYGLKWILNFRLKGIARKKGIDPAEATAKSMMTGEVNAAIAMALYLYFNEIHDKESGIVTIQRISKIYSPWSSKLYNMRNL